MCKTTDIWTKAAFSHQVSNVHGDMRAFRWRVAYENILERLFCKNKSAHIHW